MFVSGLTMSHLNLSWIFSIFDQEINRKGCFRRLFIYGSRTSCSGWRKRFKTDCTAIPGPAAAISLRKWVSSSSLLEKRLML